MKLYCALYLILMLFYACNENGAVCIPPKGDRNFILHVEYSKERNIAVGDQITLDIQITPDWAAFVPETTVIVTTKLKLTNSTTTKGFQIEQGFDSSWISIFRRDTIVSYSTRIRAISKGKWELIVNSLDSLKLFGGLSYKILEVD